MDLYDPEEAIRNPTAAPRTDRHHDHRDAAAVAGGRLAGAVRTAAARAGAAGEHARDPYVRSVLEAVQTTLQVAGALRPQGRVDHPVSLAPASTPADPDTLRTALRAAAVDVGRVADAAVELAGALSGRKSDALANIAAELRDAAGLLLDLARPDALESLDAYAELEGAPGGAGGVEPSPRAAGLEA